MQKERPYVLSIAGFDPSAGAGLLADCKTFEQHQAYGFGVCSALTIQNDNQFFNVQWLSTSQIIEQLQPLTNKFQISACKIGIIGSLDTLQEVVTFLKQYNIQIVWDPVLKASAGYSFHDDISPQQLKNVLSSINLVTPNYNELQQLQSHMKKPLLQNNHATLCAVLLKGGHRPDRPGVDTLYEADGHKMIDFGVEKVFPKHGSGCVLSAAITAELAKGNSMQQACRKAKQYIESFLNSNQSLLGYHNIC